MKHYHISITGVRKRKIKTENSEIKKKAKYFIYKKKVKLSMLH